MKQTIGNAGTATTDRPGNKSSQKPGCSKEERIKQMVVAGTPGPAHKALGVLVGNWNAEVKCWMEPDAEPRVVQGTLKANWTLKGRFVEGEFKGEMLNQPFTGRSLMGYDNSSQKFVQMWATDIQTSVFPSEGKADSDYKVITLEGKGDCPATGRRGGPMKKVFRFLNPDKYTFELFDVSNGKDVRTMEITYTRQ